MKLDFARWNHVLVPPTKAARDRYRNGRFSFLLRPVLGLFARLSREGRVLLTVLCGFAAFGVDVGRTESHVLLLAMSSLILSSLLVTRGYALTRVTAEARAPRRIALGEERTITLTLRNDSERDHHAIRVERPLLPWDGTWSALPPTIASLPAGAAVSAIVTARFVARGEHHIDPLRASALVPLGLAQGAPLRSDGIRFLVVPRIARVTQVTTPQNRRHQPGGVARASRTGDATDLLGLRPYRPGDPIRDLHARSWARLGFPVVREYQEEFFTRVGVVLDTDGTSVTPARFEAALSLAAGIIARLCRGEALIDLLVVGERIHTLSLGRSLGSLDQALDVLASVQPGAAFAGKTLLSGLGPHLDRLSSVIVIALAWDEARKSLASSIRARGVGCAVFVVGDCAASASEARSVPVDAIQRGEALSL